MPGSRKKNKSTTELAEKKKQLEFLQKAIMSIYLSRTEEDLQIAVNKTLPALCQVDSIKLTHQPNSKKSKHTYNYSFVHNNKDYSFLFYKNTGITGKEKPLLKRVGKALESTLISIEQYKQLKINKEQWELAFDTIATPICLTDLKGNILRTNKNFREKTKMSKKDLLQKHYFTVFFGKPPSSSQSYQEKRRENLSIHGKNEVFEISLQKISQNTENEIQLVILRDITEQIKMEHKVAQSVKSAEMGVISSSIAHELNNPIAGVQALLQTLEIQKKHTELSKDLKEMSLAIQRCNHIINKLLNIHR